MVMKGESLRELVHLKQRMNTLFQEMLQPGNDRAPEPVYTWTPVTDICEDEEAYHLEVEIPGVPLEEIQVTCLGNNLTVSGERRILKEITKETVQRMERYFGPFHRELTFPVAVDGDRIEAQYKQGVLTLRVPKKATRRKIEVR
jgi:HSP20 family protein